MTASLQDLLGQIHPTLEDLSGLPLAVFLIGMTVRKPWRLDLWGPAFTAMPRMLRELD